MTAPIDALPATLTANLGLSARDLAEIGGFSDRFARDLLAGRRPFPADVFEALMDIQDDIDAMTDALIDTQDDIDAALPGAADQGAIQVYRTNAELREHFRQWPGRGHAAGGFVGPHRIAALTAWETLRERGVDVGLSFMPAI